MRHHTVFLALAVALVASPVAHAQAASSPASYAAPAPAPAVEDWAGSFVIGDIGAAIGGTIGVFAGLSLSLDCDDAHATELACQSTYPSVLAGGFLLAAPAAAGTLTLFNHARGHRGSFWAALGGAYIGSAIGAGLAFLTRYSDAHAEVTLLSALTLPALGGTLGYFLSRDASPPPLAPSGALLDLGADGVVRLSLPSVGLALEGDDTTVTVTLLGGAL